MFLEAVYVGSGLILAAYYTPQIQACARDNSGLAAYSLSKSMVQLGCRAAMLPWVWVTVDSTTMLAIQGLDFALRSVEFAVAIRTLRRQGWAWGLIRRRLAHKGHCAASLDVASAIGRGV